MVVLINNNKDLDQQDQYSRAWFLVAMVAFKGLMEATISNFTLSIVQLELTYESLLPKKIDVSIIVIVRKIMPTLKQTTIA